MTTIMLLAAAVAFAVIVLAHSARTEVSLETGAVASEPQRSIEHATRILAGRYARGEITADEYRRMLTVLKS